MPPKNQKLYKPTPSPKPEYFFSNGLRKARPYWFEYYTFAKDRWFGRTLLDVYANEFRQRSPQYCEWAISMGKILVNGEPRSVDYIVRNGDLLTNWSHRHEPPVVGDAIEVVFDGREHPDPNLRDLFVIVKPGSVPVHSTGRFHQNTLLSILKHDFGLETVHTANRLDRLTSGIMVCSLSREMSQKLAVYFHGYNPETGKRARRAREREIRHANLNEFLKRRGIQKDGSGLKDGQDGLKDGQDEKQLEQNKAQSPESDANATSPDKVNADLAALSVNEDGGKNKDWRKASCEQTTAVSPMPKPIQKEYVARCVGKFPDGEVRCDAPLLEVDKQVGFSIVHESGRESLTLFKRMGYDAQSDTSIVHCRPITGRTHQIRLHLRHLGHPIGNDPIYGPDTVRRNMYNDDGSKNEEQFAKKEAFLGTLRDASNREMQRETGTTRIAGVDVDLTEDQARDVMGARAKSALGEWSFDTFESPKAPWHVFIGPLPEGVERGAAVEMDDDRVCPVCFVPELPDPKPDDLYIWLHAWCYSTEDWSFRSRLPKWAEFVADTVTGYDRHWIRSTSLDTEHRH